jgi:hypothetical protein
MTNFFEINITPQIKELFLNERSNFSTNKVSDNIFTNFSKTKILSLYPYPISEIITPKPVYIEWFIKKIIFESLEKNKSVFDVDYKSGELTLLNENLNQKTEYSLLRRLIIQVFHANGKLFVAIDPITKKYNRLSLHKLLKYPGFSREDFIGQSRCLVLVEKNNIRKWVKGTIIEFISDDTVKVEVPYLFDGTIETNSNRVIPAFNKKLLFEVLKDHQQILNLDKENKSLSTFSNSRQKYDAILKYFEEYIKPIFPLKIRETTISISEQPTPAEFFKSDVISLEEEPKIIVSRSGLQTVEHQKVLRALSQISYPNDKVTSQKIVLFASEAQMNNLKQIISQLNDGIPHQYGKFSMPIHFGIKFEIASEFTTNSKSELFDKTDIYLQSTEKKHAEAFPIVYLSKMSDSYYKIKAKFAFYAKASQVISTPSFGIYEAWNLATNLYAKLGNKPWAISDNPNMPNADIILGLATSCLKRESRSSRKVGFVNVFDKNGSWLFVKSSSQDIDFDNRLKEFPKLMKDALNSYLASGETPRIVDIHYSKKFSIWERRKIFEAIKETCPSIFEVYFISFDDTHPLRFFEPKSPTLDMARGKFFILNQDDSQTELLLSTGSSQRFQRVRVWKIPNETPIDVKAVAFRILAMTKLNWRSAVKDTSEPVTLRYAHEIAKLTNQFNFTDWQTVNNQLSQNPWFI